MAMILPLLGKAQILQNYFLIILFWVKISNVGSE